MSEKFEQRLAKVNEDLDKLSKKASSVCGDAKAAFELGQEVVEGKIKDAKGDMVAVQERIRVADEENKRHLASQVLKVQMTVKAKIEDLKTAHDKRKLEDYIDERLIHLADLYDTISYLLADAEVTALEAANAVTEYDERFDKKDDVVEEEKA